MTHSCGFRNTTLTVTSNGRGVSRRPHRSPILYDHFSHLHVSLSISLVLRQARVAAEHTDHVMTVCGKGGKSNDGVDRRRRRRRIVRGFTSRVRWVKKLQSTCDTRMFRTTTRGWWHPAVTTAVDWSNVRLASTFWAPGNHVCVDIHPIFGKIELGHR